MLNSRAPRPTTVVSLDAFNTLFVARKPVLNQYFAITSKHGISTPVTAIQRKFPTVFKQMRAEFPNYGKHTSGMSNVQWWQKLIDRLYDPLTLPRTVVDEITETFESNKGYTSYDDVELFLKKIDERRTLNENILLVVLSNGEPRVMKVLESLGLLKFVDHVYLSYDIEKFKPHADFYDHVFDDLKSRYPDKEFKREHMWHAGDEVENDLEGAYKAGWNSVLLDRTEKLASYMKEIEGVDHEKKLTLIKMVTDYQSTKKDSTTKPFVEKMTDRKFVTNGLDGLSQLLKIE
jgi:putative hydrolase of the HAD superfamily